MYNQFTQTHIFTRRCWSRI